MFAGSIVMPSCYSFEPNYNWYMAYSNPKRFTKYCVTFIYRKSRCKLIEVAAAAAAKSLQSCPTLCDPMEGSPPGSPIPGILQARTLEWVAISFSNAPKWKVKVKSLSRVRLLATPWTAAYQAPPSMGFSRQKSTGVGCHCLLRIEVGLSWNNSGYWPPILQNFAKVKVPSFSFGKLYI